MRRTVRVELELEVELLELEPEDKLYDKETGEELPHTLDDISSRDIAEVVEHGVMDNPDAFGGSSIFARFTTARIVSSGWIGEPHD